MPQQSDVRCTNAVSARALRQTISKAILAALTSSPGCPNSTLPVGSSNVSCPQVESFTTGLSLGGGQLYQQFQFFDTGSTPGGLRCGGQPVIVEGLLEHCQISAQVGAMHLLLLAVQCIFLLLCSAVHFLAAGSAVHLLAAVCRLASISSD